MTFWTLDRISRALIDDAWGALPRGMEPLGAVSTDTRGLAPNDVFVALRGEQFDAHDFLREAVGRGAAALVVSDPTRASGLGVPVIAVHDTTTALQTLGRFRRRCWSRPVVAVAGSNGKSTTKEMIRAALGSVFEVHATEGNLNNFIGVPLTLLAIPDAADLAVVEIGTNQPGEVDVLRASAEPDIAVVTSVGEEHLEGLGDLTGVLREETAVYRGVPLGIAPAAQPEIGAMARQLAVRCVEAGIDTGDVRARAWGLEADGRVWLEVEDSRVTLPVRGAHHASNAMLAVAVARSLGVPVAMAVSALARMTPLPMRGSWEEVGGLSILNDAYNANPASAREALRLLDALPTARPKVIVLGTMLELGPTASALHADIAAAALGTSATLVAGIGDFATALATTGSGSARVLTAPDLDSLWPRLRAQLPSNAVVLLKGSRGMRLERLLPLLRAWSGVDGGSSIPTLHTEIR